MHRVHKLIRGKEPYELVIILARCYQLRNVTDLSQRFIKVNRMLRIMKSNQFLAHQKPGGSVRV